MALFCRPTTIKYWHRFSSAVADADPNRSLFTLWSGAKFYVCFLYFGFSLHRSRISFDVWSVVPRCRIVCELGHIESDDAKYLTMLFAIETNRSNYARENRISGKLGNVLVHASLAVHTHTHTHADVQSWARAKWWRCELCVGTRFIANSNENKWLI